MQQKYGPYYMGITVFVLCIVTMKKGLKHVGLNLSNSETLIISLAISLIGMFFFYFYFKSKIFTQSANKGTFGAVEKVFSILMLLTACAMAFAHGSNDVANAIGPLSAVVSIVNEGGKIVSGGALTWWILPLGALGIAVGLITMGTKSDGDCWIWDHRFNAKPWLCRSNLLLR
ncbi:putative phosphate permease [Haemophilus influenzae]|uniref:Putative phosphate permease n=1 Tax=Haemophilus influenzae TaxID=727 RepID=A0A2X1PS14_HAEIF|nr:putative phosphate permease [Haemophilus influenzae]